MVQESRFTTNDGLNLFCRWHDAGAQSPCLVILHGHGEHSGRYAELFELLTREKWSFVAPDHRGHGKSEGKRVFVNSFNDFLMDIDSLIDQIPQWMNRISPVCMFGHSLGGLMATHWCEKNQARVQAVLLSSPCLGINLPLPIILLNRMIRKFKPSFVYRNPIYPPYLTHNIEEVEKYKSDGFIQRRITAQLLYEMLLACSQVPTLYPDGSSFPFYLLMAEEERVVDIRKTEDFFARIKAPSKKLFRYPGFYHEILHELHKERVFTDIASILNAINCK